jgi:uncharacterized protein YecE (DUF72 family)
MWWARCSDDSGLRSTRCGKAVSGAVLSQFPPWLYYRRSNRERIARCAQMLEE